MGYPRGRNQIWIWRGIWQAWPNNLVEYLFKKTLNELRIAISDNSKSSPAYCSICKLCHWRTECLNVLTEHNDLTLIPELGRSTRHILQSKLNNIKELAESNIESLFDGQRTIFPGVGRKSLDKFKRRADLINDSEGNPYLISKVFFPNVRPNYFLILK